MKIDLLQNVESGGCSSKISPRQLEAILKLLPLPEDPNILVNIETHDDAGVYRVNEDLALVLTTDFFPPVCSDPYEFGQIAAANSVSDVYAMGGTPVVALNIMMFPSEALPMEAFAEILRGGSDKASEAGFKIIGGHTLEDKQVKYGLAVVGYINPERIITNSGAKPGDSVILTKPIGTGVVLAGHRLNMVSENDQIESKDVMKQLNRSGADIMQRYNIKGATDITGFGLGGHAFKMAKASKVTICLNMRSVPLIGSTYRLTDEGCIPGASFRNLDFAEKDSYFANDLDYNLKMIAFDAQTSGGLLISAPHGSEGNIINELKKSGMKSSCVIGKVMEFSTKFLHICN